MDCSPYSKTGIKDLVFSAVGAAGQDASSPNLAPPAALTSPSTDAAMGPWTLYASPATRNDIRTDILGPYGSYPFVDRVLPELTTGGWRGGLECNLDDLDKSKNYISYVWIKRRSANSKLFYCGWTEGAGNTEYSTDQGVNWSENTNPYYITSIQEQMDVGQWYLAVGVIHGSGVSDVVDLDGLYDPDNLAEPKHTSTSRYRFKSGAVSAYWRMAQYEYNDTQVAGDGFDICPYGLFEMTDGTYPKVEDVANIGTIKTYYKSDNGLPATPTGDGVPSGWSATKMASSTNQVRFRTTVRQFAGGKSNGGFSIVERDEGPTTFYENKDYINPDMLIDGDQVFDMFSNKRIFRWNGSNWIDVQKQLDSNEVTEAILAAGAVTVTKIADDAISTPKLQAGAVTSTKVTTGELLTLSAQIKNGIITNAKILNLEAGKITAGVIDGQAITIGGGASGYIQGNYTSGSAGWRIGGDGNAEFNDVAVRGSIAITGVSTISDDLIVTGFGRIVGDEYELSNTKLEFATGTGGGSLFSKDQLRIWSDGYTTETNTTDTEITIRNGFAGARVLNTGIEIYKSGTGAYSANLVGGLVGGVSALSTNADFRVGGRLYIEGNSAVLHKGTGTLATTGLAYYSFQDAGGEKGWIGFGTGDGSFRVNNNVGKVVLHGSAGVETTANLKVGSTLLIGSAGDVNLYRHTANQLKTDDDFITAGTAYMLGNAYVYNTLLIGSAGDCAISRYVANHLITSDTFEAANLRTGGKVYIGGDCEISRYVANHLITPDTFEAAKLRTGGNLVFTSANGKGIRFWQDADNYTINMSSYSDGTYGGRLDSSSDYNIYFKMTGGTNRGFVFKNGTTAKAQIDGSGNIWLTGGVYVDGVQVLTNQQAAIADISTTAQTNHASVVSVIGTPYGGCADYSDVVSALNTMAAMVNELKADNNAMKARLRAHGLIDT